MSHLLYRAPIVLGTREGCPYISQLNARTCYVGAPLAGAQIWRNALRSYIHYFAAVKPSVLASSSVVK